MARCLVLGADGFIGSHLAEALANRGHSVRAFDRFGKGAGTNLRSHENIENIRGDFLNRADLKSAVDEVDYVFHFVSLSNPASSANDPLFDIDANVRMSVELFQLASEAGVKRLIFPSTGGAIYGSSREEPHREEDPIEPISPYAIGKATIEHYLRYFRHNHDLDYVVMRVSNPYGERQNISGNQGVIPIFLNLIRQGKPLTVYGDGSMVRDYIYISDLVDMIAGTFDQSFRHYLYNTGSGEAISLNNLIECLFEVTGRQVAVKYLPSRSSDVQKVVLNTDRFSREFGVKPQVALKEGIGKTWEYVLSRSNDELKVL